MKVLKIYPKRSGIIITLEIILVLFALTYGRTQNYVIYEDGIWGNITSVLNFIVSWGLIIFVVLGVIMGFYSSATEGSKAGGQIGREIVNGIKNLFVLPFKLKGKIAKIFEIIIVLFGISLFVSIIFGEVRLTTTASKTIKEDEKILQSSDVDFLPEPEGGFSAIEDKIKYPEIAHTAEIEGEVIYNVLIDESGSVIQTQVIKSIENSECDEAVINAIKNVKWNPGIYQKKPVKVWTRIPVSFNPSSERF